MDENANSAVVADVEVATVIANKNNMKAHEAGISFEQMVHVYTDWAKSYEQDLCPGRYNGPEIAADAMASQYPESERAKLHILDIAAGTGRVGVALVAKGFKLIDALEPSEGMLDELEKKGIYDRKFLAPIGNEPVVEIRADTYDALVIAGGMGEGHIPVSALSEMLRIVKQGGLIFIVMREEYLTIVEEYKKLEPFMEQLVDKQLWLKIERKVVPKYSFNNNGVVYIYQRL